MLVGLFAPSPVMGQSWRIQPELRVESRFFPQEPRFDDQFDVFQGGLVLTGQARWTSEDRNSRAIIEPYLRLDTADNDRTYFDMREATFSHRVDGFDVLVGFGQIFWGVAESRNVVDIINQFDTIEDFDQEEKLGQPLIRLSKRTDIGTFELYYMAFFREQRFPGSDGRIRSRALVDDGDAFFVVDDGDASFGRDGDEWAGDFAFRYEHTIDAFDIGLHAFYGTSREPLLVPTSEGTLRPFYQERAQLGFDVQYTEGPWLLKAEGIGVSQGGDQFVATVSGFEYTFFDIGQSGLDLGLIGEYLYDGRDESRTPVSLFQNDVFTGARLTFNDLDDTELLIGAIHAS